MSSHEYLTDLIERMLDDTLEFIPDEGVSRHVIKDSAYKEASELNDVSFIEPLKQMVNLYSSNTKKDKDRRRRIYFILEKIALNTDSNEVYEYFTSRLSHETDKYLLADVLLHNLNGSSYVPNLQHVLPLVEDTRWQVRHEILKLLGKYSKQEVENILLTLLNKANDEYEIEYLLSSLRRIHSSKVLDRIEVFINHEKGQVRASAIATLNHLGGKEFLPVFIKGLKDRSPEVKLNSLFALTKHGDENVIGILIERLKGLLKTERKFRPVSVSDSDVIHIITFLLRYQDKKEVTDLLQWVKQKKWDFLFENEREWFLTNIQS